MTLPVFSGSPVGTTASFWSLNDFSGGCQRPGGIAVTTMLNAEGRGPAAASALLQVQRVLGRPLVSLALPPRGLGEGLGLSCAAFSEGFGHLTLARGTFRASFGIVLSELARAI